MKIETTEDGIVTIQLTRHELKPIVMGMIIAGELSAITMKRACNACLGCDQVNEQLRIFIDWLSELEPYASQKAWRNGQSARDWAKSFITKIGEYR